MRTEPRTPALIPVTGAPGSGETTLVKRVCDHYSRKGLASVSGTITEETGEGGVRSGFKIRNLCSREEGRPARKGGKNVPMVGRYGVVPEDVEKIGGRLLEIW